MKKVSEKIKFWARLGQISFWVGTFACTLFEEQLPNYEKTIFSGTQLETFYAFLGLISMFIFSEVIVQLIGYFAELLDK